jgi:hypothetical protein
MRKKYSLKEISDLSREIAKDLPDYLDDIYSSEKEQFKIAIEILIQTLIDIENT